MSSPPSASDRVRCKNCGHAWYPSRTPSPQLVCKKGPFEFVPESKKGGGKRTTHKSEPTDFSSSETKQVAESEQYSQLYGKVGRPQLQSNIPTVPQGNNWCKWIIRGIIVGIPLLIVVSVCVAVVDDEEKPTRRPTVTSTSTPTQRIMATATSRPVQRTRATATARPRPTATAINEIEHQMWIQQWEYWEHVDWIAKELGGFLADGQIVGIEAGAICANKSSWTDQLIEAKDYVREYRKFDSETVAETPSLTNLEMTSVQLLDLLAEAPCE